MMARWIRLADAGPAEFDAACAQLAQAQEGCAAPILAWAPGEACHRFALIAPFRLMPGRRLRWFAWAAAPAAATYRQFGLPAYVEGEALWLHGRRIAEGTVKAVGECALVASSFLAPFPARCAGVPARDLEQAFRLRVEAQHGWQFDTSWPSRAESLNYAVA